MKLLSIHHVGFGLECPVRSHQISPFVSVVGLDDLVLDSLSDFVHQRLRLVIERLVAMDTEVALARCLLATPRAGNRRRRGLVGCLDVFSVGFGVATLARVLAKASEVPSRVLRTALAALPILDLGLAQPLEDEPASVRLAKVGRRRRLVDADPVGRELQVVDPDGVGGERRLAELRPEGRRLIVRRRMLADPGLEIRDRDDEVDGPFAGLSVDVNAHRVLTVEDIPDREGAKFARSETGFELDGDHGLVAFVLCSTDHRLDVALPGEHLRLPGRGIVVPARPRRDPRDALGWLVRPDDTLPEDPDGTPVVPVRLFVVVGPVDPADDLFGGVPVLESVGEPADLLSHACTVPEEFQVAMIGVLGAQEVELVTELDQHVSVLRIVDVAPSCLDLLPESLEPGAWVLHTTYCGGGIVRLVLESHPWLLPQTLQSNAFFRGIGVTEAGFSPDESYNTIETSSVVGADGGVPA